LKTSVPWEGSLILTKLIASPSGSLSFVATVPETAVPVVVLTASSFAFGAGLVTFKVKVVVTRAPYASVTVTVTVYGPEALALLSRVPDMSPVVGLMDKPVGNPLADHVMVSPFGSLNEEAVAKEKAVASTPDWVAIPVVVGGRLPLLSKTFRSLSTWSLLLPMAEFALK